MKKKLVLIVMLLVVSIFVLTGCNWWAKRAGGTITLDLPKGQKLVNATWKDSDLWYLTKPMKDTDTAETYEFAEDSNYGLVEGKVIFKESK